MKKRFVFAILFLCSVSVFSQAEKYPTYKGCESEIAETLKNCFNDKVKLAVLEEIKLPQIVLDDEYKGNLNILFIVTVKGELKVIYVNSPYKELKSEVERVFSTLPKASPALYNNRPTEMQFVLPITIPLSSESNEIKEIKLNDEEQKEAIVVSKPQPKKDNKAYAFLEHESNLNVPLTQQEYTAYEYYYHNTENTHTAVKPFIYKEVNKYADLDAKKTALLQPKSSWFGKKLFNEHMFQVEGNDFWFTIDPGADLQFGKDNSDQDYTYNNTRALLINGGLGKNLNFSFSLFESQGRFADYINDYAESIKPDGGNPAVVPGRGIGKEFGTRAYDYPVTEGYLSYSPSKHFNFQFGHGKNFIGDGYRSLFLSDGASSYPYFKINTQFWKIKYTNIWMWLQDVRPQATVDGAYTQKYMAVHHLSLNVTKKLNLGFFEAVMWDNRNDRGFDVNYLNPIIFFTNIEFQTGSRSGNAILGLSAKYKLNKQMALYSQLIIDDFRGKEIFGSNGWWGNKLGVQLGAKYFNAFNIENLHLQAEYNAVKPYTYSHDETFLNFGHNNQSMMHLWGSNFKESIGIARYTKGRWFANAKLVLGKKGFDYNTATDSFSYGGDVFNDNDNRVSDFGNEIAQGNTVNIFIADLQAGYLVNPATNLKLFGGFTFRDFNPNAPNNVFDTTNTTWFTIGLRTDVFDWKFDF